MALHINKIIAVLISTFTLLAVPLFCYPQKKSLVNEQYKGAIEKSVSLFNKGEIQQGKKLFIETIKKVSAPGNEEAEAAMWHKLALLIPSRDTIGTTRLYALERMHLLYQKAGNEERQIEAQKCIADVHLVQGRLDLAESQLLHVLQRYKAIGYPKLYYAYDLLMATYRSKGDFSKAIYYGLKAIESKEVNHDPDADTYYSRLASIYRELNEPEESVAWYQKLFRIRAWDKTNNEYKFRDAGLLSRELIKLGRQQEALAFILDIKSKNEPDGIQAQASFLASLAYCYHAVSDKRQAAKYYLELIRLSPQLIPNHEISTDVHYDLGIYLFSTGEFRKAAVYLNKALNAPAGINTASTTKDIYLLLYKSDSALENYRSALQHLAKFRILSDSLFNETKSRQIKELDVQYKTSEKQKNIELLKKENQLHHIRVSEATRNKNITLAGAILVFCFAGLLLYLYILKRRTNRKLEAQQKELDQKNQCLHVLINRQDKLLQEKEWLIKEVHHRVQNNLQVVTSLLNSQSAYLEDPAAIVAVKDGLRRMQAMALIHQKLYQSDNIATIAMREYISDLVKYLQNSFALGSRIEFEQVIEPLNLNITQAIPLGLIINEGLINAIKYAFPHEQQGTVRVTFSQDDEDFLLLELSDNGIGLASHLDIRQQKSLGIELMEGLTKQLNGKFTIESKRGLHITVRFPGSDHDFQAVESGI